ncbi:amino acid ABC transporter permease [uncultured Cohaesibacter sp.]|uniref:amino acid ABC transporter permease n=1 Tax=uncultured Cohaesibacter sp. TaxID=1002546 RepID=UPI00292F255D|nr:amino acid ABC transporter permease [uncultured Cohaesibacter sp.]
MIQDFGWGSLQFLFLGLLWTAGLAFITFIAGGILGMLFALGRTLGPACIRIPIKIYIELIQATPLLIVVFLAYYGLSFLGLYLPPLAAAAISMTVYATAFLADIWRGCIEAVPKGQWEAADSLGLSGSERLRYVILPQALRIAVGPTVGFMVQIVKNTSVTALIGFVELTRAGTLLNNMTFQPFHVFMSVAAMYFIVCYPLSWWSEKLKERRHANSAAN